LATAAAHAGVQAHALFPAQLGEAIQAQLRLGLVLDIEFNLFEVLAFLPDLNKYIRDNFFR